MAGSFVIAENSGGNDQPFAAGPRKAIIAATGQPPGVIRRRISTGTILFEKTGLHHRLRARDSHP
ncbi:MAG: hypothetical protein ACLFSZ_10950 [Puniceicoccaceae bacterium]